MFPDEILEEIYSRPDVSEVSIVYQTIMINAIGEVLEERGLFDAALYQSELLQSVSA